MNTKKHLIFGLSTIAALSIGTSILVTQNQPTISSQQLSIDYLTDPTTPSAPDPSAPSAPAPAPAPAPSTPSAPVTPPATPDFGIKKVTIVPTRPFSPNNGYLQGTQVVFRCEITMEDPNQVPPEVISASWVCKSATGSVLQEASYTPTFVIDAYDEMYNGSTVEITNLVLDGIDDTSAPIFTPSAVKLGKSYVIEVKPIPQGTYVLFVSLAIAVGIISLIAIIIGKIGVDYQIDHGN